MVSTPPREKPRAAQGIDAMEQIQHRIATEEEIPVSQEEKNSFMSGGVKL